MNSTQLCVWYFGFSENGIYPAKRRCVCVVYNEFKSTEALTNKRWKCRSKVSRTFWWINLNMNYLRLNTFSRLAFSPDEDKVALKMGKKKLHDYFAKKCKSRIKRFYAWTNKNHKAVKITFSLQVAIKANLHVNGETFSSGNSLVSEKQYTKTWECIKRINNI